MSATNPLKDQGYLYIAIGDKYIQEAARSAKSLKRVTPNAHITLITDAEIENEIFDQIILKPLDNTGRRRRGAIVADFHAKRRMNIFIIKSLISTSAVHTNELIFGIQILISLKTVRIYLSSSKILIFARLAHRQMAIASPSDLQKQK